MNGNIKLGRIAGFALSMNWSVLIIAWLLTWSLATTSLPHHAYGHSEFTYWLTGLGAALVFFASLLAHEVAHAIVARRHGVEVMGLTLWLFGGVATLGSEPPTPRADFRIAVAGPAASLGLAAGFELVAIGLQALDTGHVVVVAVAWLAGINLMLGLFNLIPGAPLDGGRILRAFMWHRHGDQLRATISAARAGGVVAAMLIGAGLLEFLVGASMGGLWLVFIGWFVASAARAEGADALTRANVRGFQVGDVMSHQPVIAAGTTVVSEFISANAVGSRHSAYPVIDGRGKITGMVTLDRIRRVRPSDRAATALAHIAIPLQEVPIATPTDSLWSLMDRLDATTGGRALVLENGILVGIVTPSDVTRAAQSRGLGSPVHRLVR
jgi:Zn-dependent protease/predicted transcriptional regulator